MWIIVADLHQWLLGVINENSSLLQERFTLKREAVKALEQYVIKHSLSELRECFQIKRIG